MTFTIKTPEGITAVNDFLAANAYLSGANAPGAEDDALLTEIEAEKFVPAQTSANLFGWWWTLCPFQAPARALWTKAKKGGKKAKKTDAAKKPVEEEEDDDDEDLDLFGDDPEAEAEAEKQAASRAEASKKKKKKAKKAAKSIIVFEVKGYEVDFDWHAYADKIRTYVINGVTWLDSHAVVPVAFGMMKLQMTCVIIDDLVETDDIWDMIKSDEDNIQNVDVLTFDKA